MAKVLIIASDLKTVIRFRLQLIKDFLALHHQVTVMIPNDCLQDPNIYQLTGLGINIEGAPIYNTNTRFWQDFRLCYVLYQKLKTLAPDIVLSYTIKPVIYGSLMAKWVGVPKIYAMITGLGSGLMGESLKGRLLKYWIQFLYRLALNRCRHVFLQNPDDENFFIEHRLVAPQKAVRINGSGVDLTSYAPTPFPKTIQFIFVGRLLKEKGVLEFIHAAKIVKARFPETGVLLLGAFHANPTSLKKDELTKLIAKTGIEYVNEVDDVRPYLGASSVFVLPSYREGTSRAALEALAMGRPIITTDAPGCRETVIDGVNGFFVPVKESDALVEKMIYFIHNPAMCQAMGDESRRLAEEKFDVKLVNAIIIRTMLGEEIHS